MPSHDPYIIHFVSKKLLKKTLCRIKKKVHKQVKKNIKYVGVTKHKKYGHKKWFTDCPVKII